MKTDETVAAIRKEIKSMLAAKDVELTAMRNAANGYKAELAAARRTLAACSGVIKANMPLDNAERVGAMGVVQQLIGEYFTLHGEYDDYNKRRWDWDTDSEVKAP